MGQSVENQTIEARRYAVLCEQLMAERSLDRIEVGALLGVSGDYVGKLIRGERKGIGAEIVRSACDALGISPHYFFDPYPGERSYKAYERDAAENRRIADMERMMREFAVRLDKINEQRPSMPAPNDAPSSGGVVRHIKRR